MWHLFAQTFVCWLFMKFMRVGQMEKANYKYLVPEILRHLH